MRARGLCLAVLLAAGAGLRGQNPVFESGPADPQATAGTPSGRIDEAVWAGLAQAGFKPALLCSDAVFLRRAFLTVIGTLPTEAEARAFLENASPGKRAELVEALLQRDEFADYWAMKWGDLLRVKAEFPIKLWPNAVQAYHRWIHTSLKENKPFHQFVREMLTRSGSNFREGEVNFYRAIQDRSPRGIASAVALTFMGERVELWPEKKWDAMAGFFAQVGYKATAEWKEEIVYFDPMADKDGLAKKAIFPDGTPAGLKPGQDPRVHFADWLLRPENPYFSRAIANRVWAWLMGRGVVEEPDDFRADNPPSNPQLLKVLEEEFVSCHCDLKHLFRAILNSQAYQLSCIPAQDSAEAVALFDHYPLRRLEAEVLIDALNQISGTTEAYSSPIPEPFTFIPEDTRAIALADGSITSSFLEMFGRPPRDTGYESERSRNVSAAQRLHLLNSGMVHTKVESCPLVVEAGEAGMDTAKLIERIYLTALSRMPTDEEKERATKHAASSSVRQFAADMLWALINEPEFAFVH